MKLEKVVSRPKKGLWIGLFILGLAVAGIMATSYNVEIVHHVRFDDIPWRKIVLGALGFIGIIGALVLFFLRLLREMRVSQIQADFLDRISHELRTPISTLMLVSDLLRQKTPEMGSEETRLWHSHDLELERLKTDVELLLQAAKLRESKLKVNVETIDLSQWLKQKWPSFQQLLGMDSKLMLMGESSLSSPVQLDTELFELILRNLFDNARKFSLTSPEVTVTLTNLPRQTFWTKPCWQLLVEDKGLGFSPSKENALFKRFSRLGLETEDFKRQSIPGTGLGLYLSATASKAMNLTLTGESLGEGKGAKFKIVGRYP